VTPLLLTDDIKNAIIQQRYIQRQVGKMDFNEHEVIDDDDVDDAIDYNDEMIANNPVYQKTKLSNFQKIMIAGISLAVVLLAVVIIMLIPGQNNTVIPQPVIINPEPRRTPDPLPQPEPEPEVMQPPEFPIVIDLPGNDNKNTGDVSIGTRLGELWNRGSAAVLNIWTDFDETVRITDFFRTGYREFVDAVRADSGEEFLIITITRIAGNNNVSLNSLEIKNDTTVCIKAACYNEANAEEFRLELEKLSFTGEVILVDSHTDGEGLFIFEIDMIIDY